MHILLVDGSSISAAPGGPEPGAALGGATTGAAQAARNIFVGVYFHCRRVAGV